MRGAGDPVECRAVKAVLRENIEGGQQDALFIFLLDAGLFPRRLVRCAGCRYMRPVSPNLARNYCRGTILRYLTKR